MSQHAAVLLPVSPGQSLYPFGELDPGSGYPSSDRFEIIHTMDGRGAGIRAVTPFPRGQFISRVSGHVISSRRLHTLQITPNAHLYDPYFCGLLLHSCNPNVSLDMKQFELWALRDISAGDLLTMDYASTEDVLMRQFRCHCGAPACRGWITGSKEQVNEEGLGVLRHGLHNWIPEHAGVAL
jgi:hypothetical protein